MRVLRDVDEIKGHFYELNTSSESALKASIPNIWLIRSRVDGIWALLDLRRTNLLGNLRLATTPERFVRFWWKFDKQVKLLNKIHQMNELITKILALQILALIRLVWIDQRLFFRASSTVYRSLFCSSTPIPILIRLRSWFNDCTNGKQLIVLCATYCIINWFQCKSMPRFCRSILTPHLNI